MTDEQKISRPQATQSAVTFFTQEQKVTNALSLAGRLAEAVDLTDGARDVVLAVEEDYRQQLKEFDVEVQRMDPAELHASALEAFADYQDVLAQMELSRCVDNFLCYLSDLLGEIFSAKPEVLKAYSKRQVALETVLRHSDYASLVQDIARTVVHELAYKGLEEISKAFASHGVDIFPDNKFKKAAIEATAVRNIIVHNRGVVNDVFLGLVDSEVVERSLPNGTTWRARGYSLPPDLKKGDVFPLTDANMANYCGAVWRIVIHIDAAATNKFSLQQMPIPRFCQGLYYYATGDGLAALTTPSSILAKE